MEDSECSELRKLSSGVYFLAPAETHPLLHVVLSSQTSLSVSVEALQWCSEGTIIQSSRTFLESVFGGTSNLVTVTNTSTGMGFIGLRKNLPGEILALRLEESSFWVFKSAFLCAEASVRITPKALPLPRISQSMSYIALLNDTYLVSGRETVFVQGGGLLQRKHLSAEDSLIISASALIAIEASCSMELAGPFSPIYLPYTFTDAPLLLKVRGPGRVLVSANSRQSLHTAPRNSSNFRVGVTILISAAMLFLSLMVLTRLTDGLENLLDEEIVGRLQQMQN